LQPPFYLAISPSAAETVVDVAATLGASRFTSGALNATPPIFDNLPDAQWNGVPSH
jgi:hypothetical protein